MSKHEPGRTVAPWQVDEYRTTAGNSPVREFLCGLTDEQQVRASALLRLLGERGNLLRPPASKSLDAGLFELRDLPTGVRIFYMFHGSRRVVLLDGVVKKRDKLPPRLMKRLRDLQRDQAARSPSS